MAGMSYGSGTAISDPALVDGYVASISGGSGPVTIPVAAPGGSATALALQNISSRYVRVTMNPSGPTTMLGNRSVLIAPGGTYQATFDVSSLTDIALDLPQMPALPGSGFTPADTLGTSSTGNATVLVSFG